MIKKSYSYFCDNCKKEITGETARRIINSIKSIRGNRKDIHNHGFCSMECLQEFRFGKTKEFDVKCHKCGNIFKILEKEKLFPTKKRYYCSKKCSHGREHGPEMRKRISSKLVGHLSPLKIDRETRNCATCTSEFECKPSSKQKFCGANCKIQFSRENPNVYMQAGRKSAAVQRALRRSKNEIYFYELCKGRFNKVLANPSMFNGWDADVVIEDLKIAVLWNGKWHYEKITAKHSVAQVQNRDRIKLIEISKAGYTPYVIKDMGRENRQFVEREFENFLSTAL